MHVRVVVAVESATLRRRIQRLIADGETEALAVPGRPALWESLKRDDVDLVVVSRGLLPEPVHDWVSSVRELPENPEIVVLSEREDPKERGALLASGSLAVLNHRLTDAELRAAFRALVSRRRQEAARRLRAELPVKHYTLKDFFATSPAMRQFLNVAGRVVNSDSSLLILGETGVGKERLARSIHAEGARAGGPFLAVNCGALPESLLESELFGHEEGAFTGASRARRGYFQLAHGGTLFLDEIGEVPLHLQVKLLRVLEDRTIQRVGGEKPLPVNVRIMAATNMNLEEAVAQRRFRADLYYRLAVVTLSLPPLRERVEDIPALAGHYREHFRGHLGRQVAGIRPAAMEALCKYPWPGNVRELINVVERAVLLCASDQIGLEDLPRGITGLNGGAPPGAKSALEAAQEPSYPEVSVEKPLRAAKRDCVHWFERRYLSALLEGTNGRIGETARRAGINERSLYELMKRHGLRKEHYRQR